jgi:hypothetical protein
VAQHVPADGDAENVREADADRGVDISPTVDVTPARESRSMIQFRT